MTQTLAIDQTSRLIASNLVDGTLVYSHNGDHLGTIRNFMVDKKTGQTDYAVLQFGGFLGLGSDYYPIPWHKLNYDPVRSAYVVDITRQEIENAPRHGETAPLFDQAYDDQLASYYRRGI